MSQRGTPPERTSNPSQLLGSVLASGLALALFGIVRFTFTLVGIRKFGPAFIGDTSAAVSTLTVIGILAGAGPSNLALKYIAQYLGEELPDRADRVFAGAFGFAVVFSIVAAPLALLMSIPDTAELLVYAPLFSSYLFLKGTYFSFGAGRAYLTAEFCGAASFTAVFGSAIFMDEHYLALHSLTAHLAGFVTKAVWDHRQHFVSSRVVQELRRDLREYLPYMAASLLNALAGMGSFHLVVVLASIVLANSTEVGYISALLAALGPFNLLPAAVGYVLFPELARRYGARDSEGQRQLVAWATLGLQVPATVLFGGVALASPLILPLIGVPVRPDLTLLFGITCFDAALSMISAPSGHFLNATRYIGTQATFSSTFLLLALPTGWFAMLRFGTLGAAVMRFLASAPPSYLRLLLSERLLRWRTIFRVRLLLGHGALLLTFLVVAAGPSLAVAISTGVLLVLAQAPSIASLVAGLRRLELANLSRPAWTRRRS